MISISLSSDHRGHRYNSTLISSILRRTAEPVHVRYWCRGFLPSSFELGRLKVEFLAAEEEVTGRYPGHVNPAVFDRLRVIRDMPDWDRCLILDHDMAVLCDLAPYFAEDFEGNLLMGRLFGPGNTLGLQMKQRGGLPESHAHCEDYPYFFMGPMMNLKAMREEGTWETLLEAHTAIGQDEQLSLTAACGGRVKGVDKKYNLVPQWDYLESCAKNAMNSGERDYLENGIRWRNGVPEGIIHWTGWQKPWHRGTKVWRSDLWEGEKTSWEQIRLGIWEKPAAVTVEPENGFGVRALARRGWKVTVFGHRFSNLQGELPRLDDRDSPFPDVEVLGADHSRFHETLRTPLEIVRFGPGIKPADWLDGAERLPDYLSIKGPLSPNEVRRLRALGYGREIRYSATAWPTGGPAPRVLDFLPGRTASALGSAEELYLKLTDETFEEEPAEPEAMESGDKPWPWTLPESVEGYLRRTDFKPADILQLGFGHATTVLAGVYPEASITALEHHHPWYEECQGRIRGGARVKAIFAPIDNASSWYDWRNVGTGEIDLLMVDASAGQRAKMIRDGAVSLRRHLRPGARVVLTGMGNKTEREAVSRWIETGGMSIEEDGDDHVVLKADEALAFEPAYEREVASLSDLAEKVYLISLPSREDRRQMIRENWEPLGLEFELVDGVRPQTSEIRWDEMKGMEAYGKAEHLRGSYVHGAVGCKRAGIRALQQFLESGAATALICQDDCLWYDDAADTVKKAMRELPEDWDLVYFSASNRVKNLPYSPWLVRLNGARLCTAILWKRETAERLLPELEACDCEWDLFMQRSHANLNAFCVSPMPAYQARSKSDIVGGVVQPPNY